MIEFSGVRMGGHAPCAVIAELSCNHNGELRNALALFDAAREVGATAAKLQCYSVDELVALRGDGPAPAQWGEQGMSMRDLYAQAMTPREWFPVLYKWAATKGFPLFSSVFGAESLELLESVGNPCYKLAALDYEKGHEKGGLFDLVRKTEKPVIVSCNRATAPAHRENVLHLFAPPGYPQERALLGNIKNGYDGYSYHGTDVEVPALAVAAGAKVLEVHVQSETEPSKLEGNISLTVSQLESLCAGVRVIEEEIL